MTSVSISKAARLAGISRTHFYKAYLKTGKVSQSRDESGKPAIEISELLRVFPILKSDNVNIVDNMTSEQERHPFTHELLIERIDGLKALLEAKEQELIAYREREKHLYAILGHSPNKKRHWWWPFKSF